MNETEKRRKKLLEQMRNLYQDERTIPAIHPRYKISYNQLYPDINDIHRGTFGIRCLCCILLFLAMMIYGTDNIQVREMIMENKFPGLY